MGIDHLEEIDVNGQIMFNGLKIKQKGVDWIILA
jgi:hypothetical protein